MHRLNLSGASGADICIEVPDFPDKFNYYRKPSPKLDRFDEGTVNLLTHNEKNYLLNEDVYQEIIGPFYVSLADILNGCGKLPLGITPGNAGFENNVMLWNGTDLPELDSLWLWSHTNRVQTFLYCYEGTIYLEVFPTYPWIFTEPQEGEEWFSFSQFMQSYKPYALLTVPHDVARQWCDRLACHVNELNICHPPLEG